MDSTTSKFEEIESRILGKVKGFERTYKGMSFLLWFSALLIGISLTALFGAEATGERKTVIGLDPVWVLTFSSLTAVISFLFVKFTLPPLALRLVMMNNDLEKSRQKIIAEKESDNARWRLSQVESAVMKSAIGRHLITGKTIELETSVKLIFSALEATKKSCFGITEDEMWNFVLYTKEGTQLIPKVRVLSPSHTSYQKFIDGDNGRQWKSGEGHTGKCYKDGRTILISDYSEQSAQHLVDGVPPNKQCDTDKETYVSFVAVPLKFKEKQKPMGVFVATTNIKNRFTDDNKSIIEGVARALSTVYALYQHDQEA